MREGKIILPMTDNNGVTIHAIHNRLMVALCEAFGGATRTTGEGGWLTPAGKLQAELVHVYTIAADNTAVNNGALERIARAYGQTASQQAIYWTGFDGLAHVDTLEPAAEQEAA